MEPVAIVLTTVGWLISTLLNKGVTALLDEWTKRFGLGDEFAALKRELTKIKATVETAEHSETANSALIEMLKDLQQLANQADDLLDELDYYRIQDDIVHNGSKIKSKKLGELSKNEAGWNGSRKGIEERSLKAIITIRVTESASSSSTPSSSSKSTNHAFLSAFRQASSSTKQDDILQLPSSVPSKRKLSHRMKDLVQQLQKSGEDFRNVLMLETTVVANKKATVDKPLTTTNPRETTSHMTEEVYGRDQERDDLIERLVGDEASNRALSFIAIIGQGGIGKTTLARSVYNDQRVKNHFGLQMWVTVSDNFDVKRLTDEIFESANSVPNQNFKNLNTLQSALKENLKSRRYLLVLDDLWEDKNTDCWEVLMAPLRNNQIKGNVVLITSRKPGVVKLDRTIISYNLYGLEKDEFWSLFKAWSFGNEMHEGRRNLEYIGIQIVEKLKGNPLAARTVGPLLNKKLDEEHWRQVLESKEWNYQNDENGIMPALELSYKHLPNHLKRCFSYCATFLKDYKFQQEELIRLWIAQNFIYSDCKGKRVEDIAEDCLEDLINNGFFQKLENNYAKSDYTCFVIIHDLLHDLALKVSMGECLCVDGHTDSIAIEQIVHHLSITGNSEKELIVLQKKLDPSKLSTIYFLGDKIYGDDMDPTTLESFQNWSKDATGLRVLRLRGIPNIQILLRGAANFTHLRYLKLSYNYPCNKLPEGICQLYHLQVLDVKEWPNLVELPYRFNNLVNLRHFIVQEYWIRLARQSLHSLIPGIGKLAHLQNLDEFVVGINKREFEIAQLKGLKELRGRLRIFDLHNVKSKEEAKCAGLIEKTFLNELDLSWHDHVPAYDAEAEVLEGLQPHHNLKVLNIEFYQGATSPSWLAGNVLFNLEELNLRCCYAWENLPPLGQLRNLKRLSLTYMRALKEIGPHLYGSTDSDYHMAFQCLELLCIRDMPSLEKWIWSDPCQSFPALTELQISECPNLLLTNFSLNGTEINRRFPNLQKFHSHLRSWTPLQPILQMHPLPFSARISDMHITNLGSFQEMQLHELGLTICNPRTPTAWDDISFINMKSITSLEIKSNQYLISWETLCDLICLQSLKISESPGYFSFLTKGHKSKKCFQLHSLTEISFYSCGITGKELSFLIGCAPKLSSLIVNRCPSIKYIKVGTGSFYLDFILYRYRVMNFGQDEGLLIIPSSLEHLQNLSIDNCPDLEFVSNSGFSPLASLLSVVIRGCSRLLSSMYKKSISGAHLLPPGLQELSIGNAPEGTSQLLSGLCSLNSLKIIDSPELVSLDLTCCLLLNKLSLYNCLRLFYLMGLGNLVHLQELEVKDTSPLAYAGLIMSNQQGTMPLVSLVTDTPAVLAICNQLTSLQSLKFENLHIADDIGSLTNEQDEALLHLTSLKVLTFRRSPSLRHLPAKLHLHPSIERLSILQCPNIRSFPENGLPGKLTSLLIFQCSPELEKLSNEYQKHLDKRRRP